MLTVITFILSSITFIACNGQYWTAWMGGSATPGTTLRRAEAPGDAYITQICVRHGSEIDGLTAIYSDGTVSGPWGDPNGGNYGCTAVVNDGECFTDINLRTGSNRVYSLEFITSDGEGYATFGAETGTFRVVSGAFGRCLSKIGMDYIDLGTYAGDAERLRLMRVRFYFLQVSPPTPSPTVIRPCNCYNLNLLGQSRQGGNSCYQYQADFCDDNIDSVTVTKGRSDSLCGLSDISTVFSSFGSSADGLAYSLTDDGVQVSGITDGETFRLCFSSPEVSGVVSNAGNIIVNLRGDEYVCLQPNTMPDFCPNVGPNAADHAEGEILSDGYHGGNTDYDPTKGTYVGVAICSALVSMVIVIGFLVCIKMKGYFYGNKGVGFVESEETENEI